MQKIARLNAVRAFAAIIVMISHFSNITGSFGRMLGQGGGQIGVMLFFILSGFLMSYLYSDKEPTSRNLASFFVARFARIAPLYLFVVGATYILTTFLSLPGFYEMNGLKNLIPHLLLLKGNSVLWTIPIEIHFYFLFMLFWWITGKCSGRWVLLFILLLYFYINPVGTIAFNVAGVESKILIFNHINFFILGVLLGGVFRKISPLITHKNNYYAFLLVTVLVCFPNIASLSGLKIGLWEDPKSLLLIGFVFFVILHLVSDDCTFLSNKYTDFLGEISFGLYLLHRPILFYLSKTSMPYLPLFIVFFALSVLVASLSYYLLEKPARHALRGLI